MSVMYVQNKPLTRSARKRIASAIESAQNEGVGLNLADLMTRVIDGMERDLPGEMLDYHTEQMGLSTTRDIMAAIETYIFTAEPSRVHSNNKEETS